MNIKLQKNELEVLQKAVLHEVLHIQNMINQTKLFPFEYPPVISFHLKQQLSDLNNVYKKISR